MYIFCSIFSMSMKAPFIVNEAKEALESGNSVVIGLQTTGEVQYPFEKNPPLLIHCICFGSSTCPKCRFRPKVEDPVLRIERFAIINTYRPMLYVSAN